MLMAQQGDPKDTKDNETQPLKYARLHHLLQQTSAYSKFLADKLRKQSLAVADPHPKPPHPTTTTDHEIFSQPALLTGGQLQPFQLEGVEWLVSLYENGLNGILADEMGLGKTVQCIGFFAFLCGQGVSGPFLVVAPLSTLPNWQSEFSRFAPSLKTILYHGADRHLLHPAILKSNSNMITVITNYETVMKDAAFFRKPTWKYLVIDEGHRIKNVNCRLVKELTRLHSLNRLLLTGTPLQNNLTELWSLLHFLLPDVFDDLQSFESWFDPVEGGDDHLISEQQQLTIIHSLHSILRPFLLRRLKSDVLASDLMPPKREFVIRCRPTPLQLEMMEAVDQGLLREYVKRECRGDRHQRLQSDTMQLRKICNDPRLFEHRLAGDCDSSKMMVLGQLLEYIVKTEQKVLIFSQMAKMLDLISDLLDRLKVSFVRLDGAVTAVDRQPAIDTFMTDPHCFVFLLTTRSGGLGLNLTAARFAILYDLDWNPQADRQAADRLHRIGQHQVVTVIRLRVAGSVEEERMAKSAKRKERLEQRVISKKRFKGRREYLEAIENDNTNFDETVEEDCMPSRQLLTDDELEALLGDTMIVPPSDMIIPYNQSNIIDNIL